MDGKAGYRGSMCQQHWGYYDCWKTKALLQSEDTSLRMDLEKSDPCLHSLKLPQPPFALEEIKTTSPASWKGAEGT